ncbi:MAG: hypothetical protein ABR563_10805 [Pyrinomonadaceae bacterium]
MRTKSFDFVWRWAGLVVTSALKTVVASAVFLVCAGALMRWMGYDVPGFEQLREYFRSVGRLSDVL